MKLHLLRRELTHRRGGCRPNRAAPPRRKIQTSPFLKKKHFSNILFRVEYESGLSFSKHVLVWPRSKFEISKFLPLLSSLLCSVSVCCCCACSVRFWCVVGSVLGLFGCVGSDLCYLCAMGSDSWLFWFGSVLNSDEQ